MDSANLRLRDNRGHWRTHPTYRLGPWPKRQVDNLVSGGRIARGLWVVGARVAVDGRQAKPPDGNRAALSEAFRRDQRTRDERQASGSASERING